MLFYFLVLFFCVLLSFFITNIHAQNRKLYTRKYKIYISLAYAIPLFIVMAFRGLSVGTDTLNYARIYRMISNTSNIFTHPYFTKFPVYMIYCKLLSYVSNDPQFNIVMNSAIIISCMMYVIVQLSETPAASWYLYITSGLYLQAFNTARQGLAIAICFVACCIIIKGNIIKAVLLECIAVGIHGLAIVGIIPMIILRHQFSGKFYILIAFLGFLVSTSFQSFMNLFVRIFPSYNGYLEREVFSTSRGNRMLTAITILFFSVFSGYFVRRGEIKKIILEDAMFRNYSFIVSIALLSMIFLRYNNMAARIELFYLQFIILILPQIFSLLRNNKRNKLIVEGLFYLIILVPSYILARNFVPYVFFWQ